MNPGKRFENKFRESLGGITIRINDKVSVRNGFVVSKESEADFVCFQESGNVYLVECKATSLKSFPFSKIEEHQENSLVDFENLHPYFHGLIALEFYDKRGYRYPKRMFLVGIKDFLSYKLSCGRKSLPINDAEKIGTECFYCGSKYQVEGIR